MNLEVLQNVMGKRSQKLTLQQCVDKLIHHMRNNEDREVLAEMLADYRDQLGYEPTEVLQRVLAKATCH